MKHTFSKKQILNITTGTLQTNMDDIYDFFDKVIEPGIMTHMLPNARKAILPILLPKMPGDLPKEGYYPDLLGEVLFEFSEEDKTQFWANYNDLPSLLEGKKIITAII